MSKNIKIIGGIGSIFMILGFIPGINYFMLVGIILLLIAYFYASNEVNEKDVFNNAFTGFIIYLINSIFYVKLSLNNIYEFFNLINLGFGILFILKWIISIISGYKLKKADDLLSIKTNENLFESAGLLIFIGSILNIIFIGAIITIIAYILKTIAFFKTKEKET